MRRSGPSHQSKAAALARWRPVLVAVVPAAPAVGAALKAVGLTSWVPLGIGAVVAAAAVILLAVEKWFERAEEISERNETLEKGLLVSLTRVAEVDPYRVGVEPEDPQVLRRAGLEADEHFRYFPRARVDERLHKALEGARSLLRLGWSVFVARPSRARRAPSLKR